jgi:hypothetical protein
MITTTRSQTEEYDPWIDTNDDGVINIYDLVKAASIYGTEGDPTKNVNVNNWPTLMNVNVISNTKSFSDYSKVFFFRNMGLPFDLRAFSMDNVIISGTLTPDGDSYLKASTSFVDLAYVYAKGGTSAYSYNYEFTPVVYIPTSSGEDLRISGSGNYYICIQNSGTKKNLLNYTLPRHSPIFEDGDWNHWTTQSQSWISIYQVDLGEVKECYIHTRVRLFCIDNGADGHVLLQRSVDNSTWEDLGVFDCAGTSVSDSWVGSYGNAQYFRYLLRVHNEGNPYSVNASIPKMWIIGS